MSITHRRLVRAWQAVAATALLTISGLATAAPAAAAAPAMVIWSGSGNQCLDQYFAGNAATTQVRTVGIPCGFETHQQWRFEYVRSPNAYRVINVRADSRGPWCLSAPNGTGSGVFAELCVNPVPLKQTWIPALRRFGCNQLRNESSFQCLEQNPANAYEVYVDTCDRRDERQEWFWYTAPGQLQQTARR